MDGRDSAFLLSLDCCLPDSDIFTQNKYYPFYYLLIAARRKMSGTEIDGIDTFYYLLIAAEGR